MQEQARYTHVAAQAVSLADLFESRFAAGLEGPVPFQIHLAAPEGPSTGGGKQVVQPITLVPKNGGPTIVVGAANTIKQTAELRSFALLSEQYQQRYKGAPIPVHAGAYQQLLTDFTSFFRSLNLQVTTVDATRSMRPPPPKSSGPSVLVALAVSFGFLAVAAWIVFSQLRR